MTIQQSAANRPIEQARSIHDLIRATATDSESGRRLAPAAVEAFSASGLWSLMTPRELGGAEADPLTQLDVVEDLSRADGSAGWCLSVGAVSRALAGGFLGDEAIDEIFKDPGVIIAGAVAPQGQATAVDGGYRVSGRWRFGSGCQHSAWLLGGCVVMRENGPEWRVIFVPRHQVTIHDNWHVAGLKGTGSCDYSVDDVFVPEGYTLDPIRIAPRRGGALYRMPMSIFGAASHAGFALGVARRSLDEIAQVAISQPPRSGSAVRLADRPAFQQAFARADAALRAARLLVVDSLEALWAAASSDQAPTIDHRATVRLAVNHATDVAAETATMAYRFGGGAALYDDHILQRCFRDIHAASQHAFVSDEMYERYAQTKLGNLPPDAMI